VVTCVAFVECLAELLGDVPTRLAMAGLAGCLGASGALVWWASHHYVTGRATGWQWTTWEKALEAEQQAARREWDHEAASEAADELDGKR
jgi:hypothetical protein